MFLVYNAHLMYKHLPLSVDESHFTSKFVKTGNMDQFGWKTASYQGH